MLREWKSGKSGKSRKARKARKARKRLISPSPVTLLLECGSSKLEASRTKNTSNSKSKFCLMIT